MYKDFISKIQFLDDYDRPTSFTEKGLINPDGEYEFTRRGLPTHPIKHDKVGKDIKMVLDHFYEHGYSATPPNRFENKEFMKSLFLFRTSLDMWESIDIPKSMDKDEIYFHCLKEGPSFTEWVKKARSTTLRYLTSETNTSVEEEYLLDRYEGYDSMFHERMLIHWDDTESIEDMKYAFIPTGDSRQDEFRRRVKKLFKDHRINEIEFSNTIDMLAQLKNSVMLDPVKKKTSLMRHFWGTDINTSGSYYSSRRIVPVHPAGTRDTGVGDPGTVLKVKELNMLARQISERLPYSANASVETVNKRLRRLLKKNSYLHLDFKKFGLTFPRSLMNIMIEEIGLISGIDTDHLIIHDFFVEMEGDVYKTTRGTMLGWLDSINSLCVCAILHWMASEDEICFDFLTFNDDVEIGKHFVGDQRRGLEMLRMAVIAELSSFDIPISQDKTYGSKASVFLEKYTHFKRYDLDMNKRQLAVKQYAQSACVTFPWLAKLYFSMAYNSYRNEYLEDRCIFTLKPEFCREETSMSLWAGGWYVRKKDGLDDSYVECDERNFILGLELDKFKRRKYTSKMEKMSSNDNIQSKVESNCYGSYGSDAHVFVFPEPVMVSSINDDIDIIKLDFERLAFEYEGKDIDFSTRIMWVIGRSLHHMDRGPRNPLF